MKRGWIINFKNGYRVILSESAYKKYQLETPKEDILSEEPWENIENAIKNNPDLDFIE